MHRNLWWHKASGCHGFFDPKNDVIPGASSIVSKIVIKAYLFYIS